MIDEARIIAQLRDESQREKAFNTLVQEYQEALYWQIRRLVISHDDADDVLQNMGIYRGNDEIIPNIIPDDSLING